MKNKRWFPCGQTRREFVWDMGAGFAGLALTSLLASDRFFAQQVAAESIEIDPGLQNPLAAHSSHLDT